MGPGRRNLTARKLNALGRAGFPYLIEGDATDASVMGTSAKDGAKAGVSKLGTTGRAQGVFMFDISEKFADEFSSGSINPDFLNGATWAIQNHEVRRLHLCVESSGDYQCMSRFSPINTINAANSVKHWKTLYKISCHSAFLCDRGIHHWSCRNPFVYMYLHLFQAEL